MAIERVLINALMMSGEYRGRGMLDTDENDQLKCQKCPCKARMGQAGQSGTRRVSLTTVYKPASNEKRSPGWFKSKNLFFSPIIFYQVSLRHKVRWWTYVAEAPGHLHDWLVNNAGSHLNCCHLPLSEGFTPAERPPGGTREGLETKCWEKGSHKFGKPTLRVWISANGGCGTENQWVLSQRPLPDKTDLHSVGKMRRTRWNKSTSASVFILKNMLWLWAGTYHLKFLGKLSCTAAGTAGAHVKNRWQLAPLIANYGNTSWTNYRIGETVKKKICCIAWWAKLLPWKRWGCIPDLMIGDI